VDADGSLKREIKELIVEVLALDDVAPEEIEDSEPLFVEGLGLDSIDALEIALAIEKRWGVKIRNEELGQEVMFSVETLADHIGQQT
jgi:acyl carrier protein